MVFVEEEHIKHLRDKLLSGHRHTKVVHEYDEQPEHKYTDIFQPFLNNSQQSFINFFLYSSISYWKSKPQN